MWKGFFTCFPLVTRSSSFQVTNSWQVTTVLLTPVTHPVQNYPKTSMRCTAGGAQHQGHILLPGDTEGFTLILFICVISTVFN